MPKKEVSSNENLLLKNRLLATSVPENIPRHYWKQIMEDHLRLVYTGIAIIGTIGSCIGSNYILRQLAGK